MSPETNLAVVQEYVDAINANDIDREMAILTDNVALHTPIPGLGQGKDAFRGLMQLFHGAFPEQHLEVRDLRADGDKVVLFHTHHLVHGGEFMGVPPSGNTAVIDGVEIYRIADGKIAEFWHADDFQGLLRQLELTPPAAMA
jgi:steroid delta-isomerase-like uncharacterized protein